jgi:hypothetical protein
VVAVDLEKQEENKSNKNKSVDEVQSVKFDDLN